MVIKKHRDSNMELLRITSMLFVLICHADFLSLGIPTAMDIKSDVFGSFSRFFFESATICCVNIFILLSGWYKITPRTSRLIEFLFQILFFVFISIFVNIVFWGHQFDFNDIKNIFMLNNGILWFPKSYLLLYILSPVLNAFAFNVEKRTFEKVLIGFFVFQAIYGWMTGGVRWFNEGYSTMSFIGLYLVARYLRLYYYPFESFKLKPITMLALFIAITFICSMIWCSATYKGYDVSRWLISLASPFAILQSILLLLFFSKISLYSKKINWIASSCFAVYLFHCAPNMLEYYTSRISEWYVKCSSEVFILNTLIFIATVFVMAILIDKLRIMLWYSIQTLVEKINESLRYNHNTRL